MKIYLLYQVKTDKFEGPLELLLELIEKEKLDVTELSLAKVADEYLEYIRNNDNILLANLAEFLGVASKLILIKSRALLPMLQFTAEEEAEIQDLAFQLEEYQKFKAAAATLAQLAAAGRIGYSREGFGGVRSVFYPPQNFNVYDFKKYFQLVLAEIPVIEKLQEEVVGEVVTLEERINDIEQKLRARVSASFSELVAGAQDKVDVIVSFLAMLEMVKQRLVLVEQGSLFEEIKLSMSNQ